MRQDDPKRIQPRSHDVPCDESQVARRIRHIPVGSAGPPPVAHAAEAIRQDQKQNDRDGAEGSRCGPPGRPPQADRESPSEFYDGRDELAEREREIETEVVRPEWVDIGAARKNDILNRCSDEDRTREDFLVTAINEQA